MVYVRTIQSYNQDVFVLIHMVVSSDDSHVPIQNHHPSIHTMHNKYNSIEQHKQDCD
jgi:hypothetical protein